MTAFDPKFSMDGVKLMIRLCTTLREIPDDDGGLLMDECLAASISEMFAALLFGATLINRAYTAEQLQVYGISALMLEDRG